MWRKKTNYVTKNKRKVNKDVVNTVKKVITARQEHKTHDTKVTSVQVLTNQLSNTSSYRCDFGTDIPLFSNSAANQDGRIGREIDIRKMEWSGNFRLVSSLWSALNLRFILVKWTGAAGGQPTVGKIITDNATVSQVYQQSIAPDCPYTILMDKRMRLTPPSLGTALPNDFTVRFTWKTPKTSRRLVEFSENNISLDYTAVMKGLYRLYWFSENDLSDPAYTSIQQSWSRVTYVDA